MRYTPEAGGIELDLVFATDTPYQHLLTVSHYFKSKGDYPCLAGRMVAP